VSLEKNCEKLVQDSIQLLGGVDGIIFEPIKVDSPSTLKFFNQEKFLSEMYVSVGSFISIVKFAKEELSLSKGTVIATSSILANLPATSSLDYCIVKAALDMAVKVLALDLGSLGINIIAVSPGVIDTGRHKEVFGDEKAKEFLSDTKMVTPMGRLGTIDEVSSLYEFLLSSQAKWITGTIITIDGGETLATCLGKVLSHKEY